jgi:hypothetical protein
MAFSGLVSALAPTQRLSDTARAGSGVMTTEDQPPDERARAAQIRKVHGREWVGQVGELHMIPLEQALRPEGPWLILRSVHLASTGAVLPVSRRSSGGNPVRCTVLTA